MNILIAIVIGFIVLIEFFCIGVAVWMYFGIKHSLDADHVEIRAKHVEELEAEKRATMIARHDLELDAAALTLACLDLMTAVDPKTGAPFYPGVPTWKHLRAVLRNVAERNKPVKVSVVPE